jgi:hypothetical protein
VDVVDGYFDLPPQMESAIHVEENEADASIGKVNGQSDVRQGFYDIVNPFTYLDPSMAHDNPFIDLFLQPHPTNSGVMVRRYFYPGFDHGRILVIGPKAYVPITQDADFLIVQNVPAIKRMIQSIEYSENNQAQSGQLYYDQSIGIIVGEIKKHQMDPRFIMKRKGDYEADLVTFAPGSKGWTRARIALEVPGAMSLGKEDLGRIIDRGQLRMMERGMFKGCLEQFNATITDGHIYFPTRVQTVLAASFDGVPIPIRSIFFQYLENGPGNWDCTCEGRLDDEGETFFPSSGTLRRTYRARVGTDGSKVQAVCKLRWEVKDAGEQLTIRNLEANRLMTTAIMLEQNNHWAEAQAAVENVLGREGILQKELGEYLKGVKHTVPFAVGGGLSMADLGEML